MVVNSDQVAPKPDDTVVFWGSAVIIGPVLVCVAPFVLGWVLGAIVDLRSLIRPTTPLQVFVSLGALWFPMAAFIAARRRWNSARARAAAAWPTVPGTVERSQVKQGASSRGLIYHRLMLAYRYEVGGRRYEGDRVQFGPQWVSSLALIERLAAKYPARAQVTVRYDPGAPDTAVLETSDDMAGQNFWPVWWFLAAPFVLSLLRALDAI